MTQTLTTERQQFEEYFNDFYGCHPTDHHDPIHVEGIWHAWQDGNTRAASREAQPVAIVESSAYVTAAQIIGDEPPMKAVKELYAGALVIGQHLYTAPPAPAVPEEMNGITPYCHGWNECRAAMLAQPISHGYKLQDGWIACSERLPKVGGIVLISNDGYVSIGELERSGANYRYFTSVATGRELTVTHWMPLPAAPEGGNDA